MGKRGQTPHPEKSQKRLLSNASLDPLKNHDAAKPASIQCSAIIGPPAEPHLMAFRWWTDDLPHIVVLDPISPSPLKNKKSYSRSLWQNCLDLRMLSCVGANKIQSIGLGRATI